MNLQSTIYVQNFPEQFPVALQTIPLPLTVGQPNIQGVTGGTDQTLGECSLC